ncbi:protein LTO1 homolog [Myripristis murdjan]|uniref:LTO1 maturation factor of ABCE1 n=1 Tax=Myripristis murdjan TaxID=586833 RepID=A0A667Y9Z2_9TELE|nr:protein LTO1 homolog [Myripristis murdjan]
MESESGNDDLFDCIFMADNRFHGVGYREGFERGTQRGLRDGHRHGVSHGAKLSAEVSFYYGFAVASKCLLQDKTDTKSRKRVKAVDALLELINKCPLDDPYYTELQEDMDRVRGKFRQVCSLLSVPADFKDYIKTSGGTSF